MTVSETSHALLKTTSSHLGLRWADCACKSRRASGETTIPLAQFLCQSGLLPAGERPGSVCNYYFAIYGGHVGALGIRHRHANQECARLYIESGFHTDAGAVQTFQRRVSQPHFYDFLQPCDQIPVFVEDGRGYRQVVFTAIPVPRKL